MSITLEELRQYAEIAGPSQHTGNLGTLLAKKAKKAEGADPVADVRELRSRV